MKKAFLSHSSKDKSVVDPVFQELGAAGCVYDSESFEEGKPISDEIRRGISESALFVFFASRNSLSSDWVENELQEACVKHLSKRGMNFLVFALDDTLPNELPQWMQEFVARKVRKPRVISRRIQTRLLQLDVEEGRSQDIFIGRDSELGTLKEILAKPPARAAHVLAIAGWSGIGRRTLAKKGLSEVYSYLPAVHPTVPLSENCSIDDFYFRLESVAEGRTPAEWENLVAAYSELSPGDKVGKVVRLMTTIHDNKEILFILDEGGLLDDEGSYVPWFENVLSRLEKSVRPYAVVIQRRMIPYRKRLSYKRVEAIQLDSFQIDDVKVLLGLLLRQKEIYFTEKDVDDLADYVGGHPMNAHFAVGSAEQYGLDNLIRDKTELAQYQSRYKKDLLRKLKFGEIEEKILTILTDYDLMELEQLFELLGGEADVVASALRRLNDWAVVEHIGEYYRVAPFLRQALPRVEFKTITEEWRKEIASKVADILSAVSEDEGVSYPLMSAAIFAGLRNPSKSPNWLSRLILPSHLLRIAREEYNHGRYNAAVEMYRKALEKGHSISDHVRLDALRFQCLALARLGRDTDFFASIREVQKFSTQASKQHFHFLRGFRLRQRGQFEEAEEEYRKAYAVDASNFHVLRELAQTLALQEQYVEAEEFARKAYHLAPDNPWVIDCLCNVLLGKEETPQDLKENHELADLLKKLRVYGELEGKSFYEQRQAEYFSRIGEYGAAMSYADEAVQKASHSIEAHYSRAQIRLRSGDIAQISEDISQMDAIASLSEGRAKRFLLDKVKCKLAMERGNFEEAEAILARSSSMPSYIKENLSRDLAARRSG